MARGMVGTFDLTVGVIVDMEDLIYQLDPDETPLQGLYGAEGMSAVAIDPLSMEETREKKTEWLEDSLLVPRDTLSASVSSGAATIGVANGLRWGIGDIARIDDEVVEVTDISTNTLTVTRGIGDTTGASHASAAAVIGIGKILPEGSDPEAARSQDRSSLYNHLEIFGPEKIDVTGTELVVAKYGLNGVTEFDYQLMNRTREQAVSVEQALLYGERFEDTSAKKRSMGGFTYFTTTNVDSTTTTLTETAFLDMLQDCYDAGGFPNRALMGAKQKRVMSAFGSSNIRYGRTDNGRGQTVDFYDSDFTRISLLLHRWMRLQDLFVYSRDNWSIVTLRGFRFETLAKTGDSKQGQILCEKSMKLRREKHAGRFSALT